MKEWLIAVGLGLAFAACGGAAFYYALYWLHTGFMR